jgi:adenine deaminase
LSYGVTTSIRDPHEIANVPGQTGLRYFLDATPAAEHIQRQVAVAIVIALPDGQGGDRRSCRDRERLFWRPIVRIEEEVDPKASIVPRRG